MVLDLGISPALQDVKPVAMETEYIVVPLGVSPS